MALSAGDRLGHYEIVSLLGKGGMGEVYRARDTKSLDRRSPSSNSSPSIWPTTPSAWRAFAREAKLLASLNHPHIAGIYDLDEAQRPAASS